MTRKKSTLKMEEIKAALTSQEEFLRPVLLFLYADKNGNGIREGEEPAQFRLTLGYTAVSNAFRSTP